MGQFNNRETAVVLWGTVGLVWALRYPAVRSSLASLARSVFGWKLQLVFWLLVGYASVLVWGLATLELWAPDLLKDTLVWFLFGGVVLVFEAGTAKKQDPAEVPPAQWTLQN